MSTDSGVYSAVKKDGTLYYRSNITYQYKHISLGSYSDSLSAHEAYLFAQHILATDTYGISSCHTNQILSFDKQISLINFRDHDIYFANPIYLYKHFFEYYLTPEICLKFDIDDLFYYSSHKITQRGGHLCVADYGSQISIITRHGLKPYSVYGRDYTTLSQDPYDFRRQNLCIINPYQGVFEVKKKTGAKYKAVIHLRSNYVIGTYDTAEAAAIAYNKAIDILTKKGVNKNFTPNYLANISPAVYASLYTKCAISSKILNLNPSISRIH